MSGSEGCQERLLTGFESYDSLIDLSTCWEAFLTSLWGNNGTFRFEGSTKFEIERDQIIPAFSACFDDDYGVIGDVLVDVPSDEAGVEDVLERASKIDKIESLKNGLGNSVDPELDYLLIVQGADSPQFGNKIYRKFEDGFEMDGNLVLMRWDYQTSDESHYQFQRELSLRQEFRDDQIRSSAQTLDGIIGEEGGYQTIEVAPRKFVQTKADIPLCNYSPPPQYLATYLWGKVFPIQLSPNEYRDWAEGQMNKKKEIEVSTPGDLATLVNSSFLFDMKIREPCVEAAMNFLCSAKLARKDENNYVVNFTGLVSRPLKEEDSPSDLDDLRAKMFGRYCDYQRDGGDRGPQSSLDNF